MKLFLKLSLKNLSVLSNYKKYLPFYVTNTNLHRVNENNIMNGERLLSGLC